MVLTHYQSVMRRRECREMSNSSAATSRAIASSRPGEKGRRCHRSLSIYTSLPFSTVSAQPHHQRPRDGPRERRSNGGGRTRSSAQQLRSRRCPREPSQPTVCQRLAPSDSDQRRCTGQSHRGQSQTRVYVTW